MCCKRRYNRNGERVYQVTAGVYILAKSTFILEKSCIMIYMKMLNYFYRDMTAYFEEQKNKKTNDSTTVIDDDKPK